ncbi:hypothetical protein [Neorhizobium galegae]|uniref:hypothetical protein n=1 Tax=Neorhizobium galegae TaxID=399 RepID=UPI00155EE806|nr:hypothetical protein [Neorhizobium galegae]
MKDTDYYSVRWSTNAAITQTKLPQVVSLVPVLGYAILYGDQFQSFVMRFTSLGPDVLFTAFQRVCLLYAGGLCVLAGLIIFYVFCPSIIRQYKTRTEYIRHVMETSDYRQMADMNRAMISLLEGQPKEGDELYFNEFPAQAVLNAVKMTLGFRSRYEVFSGTRPRGTVYPGLAAYFEAINRTRWFASILCNGLMIIGAGLFLLPSVDVFFMVVDRVIFSPFR